MGGRAVVILLLLAAACRPPGGAGPIGRPPAEEPPPAPPGVEAPVVGTEVGGALIRVAPEVIPSLRGTLGGERRDLEAALDRSLEWFGKPSSREHFPRAGVTHQRARLSVAAFRSLLSRLEGEALQRAILREFEVYASAGSDGRGTVLFTGYYSPLFAASREKTAEYRYPLYGRPEDLVVDSGTGEVLGRRVGERVITYPTRADIERSGMLAGEELFWLGDRFDVYVIQVQGSALLKLGDGTTAFVSYAGNNGHEYVSVARELVKDGHLSEEGLSLERMRMWFEAHPDQLERYLYRNPRYVFFREEDGRDWPKGSLGVQVTPLRSVATDKTLFPPGGVVLVVTEAPDGLGRWRRLRRFMLDQDTGGAIRTPGRADIYFGIGAEAEKLAGRQHAEGRLYYFFLRPDRVAAWRTGLDF